jgi:NAD(P)-dependent dehydrogenase (short-subunit alcohol dehydrogenase family)
MLTGRVALVTGGGRGLGRAVALALARRGAAVGVAARTLAQVEAVAAEIAATGPALAVILDVTDPAAVATATARTRDTLGPVDILVNTAGIAESAPFARTDLGLWQRHLAVNATGPYLVTRACLPAMLERGWGRVVNVASVAGLEGAPYIAAYTASKHALVGLTRALAAEVAGRGVTANAVCPGFAATDLTWESARRISRTTGRTFDEAVGALAALNPSGRLIEPEEVADAVLTLVGNGSDARNGEAVVVR